MYSLNVVSQHTHKPVVTAILTYIFLLRGSKPGIDVDGGGGRRGCHSRGGKGKGELRDCVCYISQNRVVIETKVERILSFESFAIAVVFKPPSFYLFPPSKVVKVWILIFYERNQDETIKKNPTDGRRSLSLSSLFSSQLLPTSHCILDAASTAFFAPYLAVKTVIINKIANS